MGGNQVKCSLLRVFHGFFFILTMLTALLQCWFKDLGRKQGAVGKAVTEAFNMGTGSHPLPQTR
jgi:hypothetical protein